MKLTDKEIQSLIELGTGDALEYDKFRTMVDLFVDQAGRTPDAVAVADKDGRLTYWELDEQSNALAHWLVEKKCVEPNDFVAVMMPRVKEFAVAVFGIWKAGAAYVPIDLEYPEERKRFILDDCEARAVISAEDWPLDALSLSTFKRKINLSNPSGLAYMIYTSGSTGRPKGVMVGQDGLLNYVRSTIRINGITASDRVSAYRSFSFDSHIEEFFPSLAVGASVYIIPESDRKDISAIERFISDNGITVAYFTTSLAVLLYKSCSLPIRFIGAVGEKLNGIVSGGNNGVRILNTYGPTECTDHISTYWLEDGRKYENIPIGRPLHNGVVLILDEELNLVPRGEAGELCFVSVQLARGYWKRPELTAEKFVDCPYIPGAMMYRTGDLCRWNEEGQLEYIGRKDNQVKIHGYRIELGEIEAVAAQCEGVNQVAAAVKNGAIVLYWCGPAEDIALESYLKDHLAEFMIPAFYKRLDAMPLNGNGKIDRKSLPEVCEEHTDSYVAPSSNREAALCYYLSAILNVDRVGVTDSFKSLGMDSLSAMNAAFFLNRKGLQASVEDLIKSDNVRGLAKALESKAVRRGYWFDGYDESKETVVYVLGIIAGYAVNDGIKVLAETFNVYVLETMYIVWPDLNPLSFQDVVDAYYTQIVNDIPSAHRVKGIMGFSVAGKLAYSLACRYERQFGVKPLVFLGDTSLNFSFVRDIKPLNPSFHPDMVAALRMTYESVENLGPMPEMVYEGESVFLLAEKESGGDISKEWERLLPNMKTIRIDDNHNGLFQNPQHYGLYKRMLLDADTLEI